MAREYWDRLRDKLGVFTEKGDTLRLTRVKWAGNAQTCELCGYEGIRWLHWLTNLRTGKALIVGSKCITNYKKVHDEMYQESLKLTAANELSKIVRKINARSPGAIVLESTIAYAFDIEDGWDSAYDPDDEAFEEEIRAEDPNDLAPEGLGSDELDWDARQSKDLSEYERGD